MTYWIIFEGPSKCGKSSVVHEVGKWLSQNNIVFKYVEEREYFKNSMVNGRIDLDKLYDYHEYHYALLREQYDVVLLDSSFVTSMILCTDKNDAYREVYLESELELLRKDNNDKITLFTLIRHYDDGISDEYIDVTHSLLTQYHVDSKVWSNTDDGIQYVVDNVKDDLSMELLE